MPLTLDSRVLACVENHADGVTASQVAEELGATVQDLGEAFEKLQLEGKIKSLGGVWLSNPALAALSDRFLTSLTKIHQASKAKPYVSAELVADAAEISMSGKPLARLVEFLSGNHLLLERAGLVRHAEFLPRQSGRREAFLEAVKAAVEAEPIKTPSPFALTALVNAPLPAIEEALQELTATGRLARMSPEVYYTPQQVERILETLAAAFDGVGFEPRDIRDKLGISRKYADAILAHLEEKELLTREGPKRFLAVRA